MGKDKDDSFKSMGLKGKVFTIVIITLLIALVIGFVFTIFFFGFVGIFEILGVQYDSIWALFIFVAILFVIGFVAEIFIGAIIKIILQFVRNAGEAFILQFLFSFAANWLFIVLLDMLMDSITITFTSKLIIALILGVLDPTFDNKYKKT